ncbi:hypothetical protein [Rhizobium phage RHph_X3_9]|nr:hypothetical protein [Rhizobium phage RHph_X3_9]
MTKELSVAELAALAGELEDQTEEQASMEFDNTPPEGVTVGRLIEYIELGKHPQKPYQGKAKPDADMVRLTFELLGPDNIIEFEKDGVKMQAGQLVSIRMKKSLSDKASFKKLFKKLQYGREDKKHIAQMLGEAFIITIYHNKVNKDGKERLYVNLHKDGEFGIGAPFAVDPISKVKTAYDIKAHTQPLRLFLWDRPQKNLWDSLFIDGTKEVKKEDGTVEHVSKNWLQELILSAKNINGSPLHVLLSGVAGLPTTEAQAAVGNAASTGTPTASVPGVATEQAASSAAAAPATVQNATASAPAAAPATAAVADPLAALGLVKVA